MDSGGELLLVVHGRRASWHFFSPPRRSLLRTLEEMTRELLLEISQKKNGNFGQWKIRGSLATITGNCSSNNFSPRLSSSDT